MAQSKGLEVTGRNMTNVNTTGYSRQVLNLDSGGTYAGPNGPESMGVRITGVTQARDIFLDSQVQVEKSMTGGFTAQQDIYNRVEAALSQNIDTSSQSSAIDAAKNSTKGIGGALNDFFTAVQAWGNNPSDPAAKSPVLEAATTLVQRINDADSRLSDVQTDTTNQLNSDVNSVNQLLKDISGLNEQIGRYESGNPDSALDLRDQRQAKLEELSGYLNFETQTSASGNGQLDVIARDPSGNKVTLVAGNAVPGAISLSGSTFSAGSPPVALGLTTGSLVAKQTARDGFAQSVRDDLATFANQLQVAVNGAYNSSGTVGNFFAAGSGTGSLIQVDPNLTTSTLTATATGDAGANELAGAVAALATKKFSTANGDLIDGSMSGFYGSTVARVGTALKTASSNLQDQQLTEQLATSRRDQVSGVSLDEETANLMKYQRAFQASARYVTTVDSMLDTVVNQMGRT